MPAGTVVVVPGIGGSTLTTPPSLFGFGPPIEVWLVPAALAAGGWRLLGLSADGVTPDVPLTGRLTPGLPLGHYYATLTYQLERLGWRVVSPRGDWRLQALWDAATLADLIRREGASGPVHVLAQSRGGLVLRAALELLRLTGELGLVGRCAGLGVPHWGSWAAQGLIGGWVDQVVLMEFLLTAPLYMSLPGYLLGQVVAVTRTWPGAYELLPRPGAPGLRPDQSVALYQAPAWVANGMNASQSWLSAAQSRWESLPWPPPAVDWVDVVGVGVSTPLLLRGTLPPRLGSELTWGTDGDGTVPASWAAVPNRRRITTPTGHGSLISDGRVIAALDSYFRHGLNEDIVIGGPVLN